MTELRTGVIATSTYISVGIYASVLLEPIFSVASRIPYGAEREKFLAVKVCSFPFYGKYTINNLKIDGEEKGIPEKV